MRAFEWLCYRIVLALPPWWLLQKPFLPYAGRHEYERRNR